MITVQNWYDILVTFIAFMGMTVSMVLVFGRSEPTFSGRLLGIFLFCISLILTTYTLHNLGFYHRFPHLWRANAFPSLCVAPAAYLYVRSVLYQQYRFRRSDLLFLLPAILYVVNLMPFYLQPAAYKLEVIDRAMSDFQAAAREPEGMIPPGWGMILRTGYSLSLALLQAGMLARYASLRKGSAELQQNKEIFRWLCIFTGIICLFFFTIFLEYVFHISQVVNLFNVIKFTFAFTILACSLYLLFKPHVLYGLQGWFQYNAATPAVKETESAVPVQSFSMEERDTYRQSIELHFQASKPFLQGNYKIRDLSDALRIPPNTLSAFINQEYGKNFNEFINDHRVDTLAGLVQTSPEYSAYTLESLGKLAGFNSRSAFIAAVKRRTGKTPRDFFGPFLKIQGEL